MVFHSSTKDSNQVEESHGTLRLVVRAASITSDHFSLKNVLRQWLVSGGCRSENKVHRMYIHPDDNKELFSFFLLHRVTVR